jgi:hypothetical protein
MSRITRQIGLLLTGALLFGCAAAQIPGETQADSALQIKVMNQIKQLERADQCPTLDLTVADTQITQHFDGRRAQEKWNVLSCNGENHAYEVDFSPSPDGGTDAGVRKWPD